MPSETLPAPVDMRSVGRRLDFALRQGFSSRLQGESDAPLDSPSGRFNRLCETMQSKLKEFGNAVNAINNDPALTTIGKNQRLAEITKSYLQAVEETIAQASFLPYMQAALSRANKKIADAIELPDPEDVAALLREQSVANILRAMDSSARFEAWKRITDSGDPVGIAAVLNSPKFLPPLLPAQVVDEGVSIIVAGKAPDAVKAKQAAETAIAHTTMLRDEMNRIITETTNYVPPRDRQNGAAA